MSVSKLLARIVAPEAVEATDHMKRKHYESLRHDHTYGKLEASDVKERRIIFANR